MQNSNVFQEATRKLKAFRTSSAYSPEERLLVTSGYYEQIGENTIDSMLRKLACTFFEEPELEDKYRTVRRTIYRLITEHFKVSDSAIRECAAYAFINKELNMLKQLEEVLGTFIFDAALVDQTEQMSDFDNLNQSRSSSATTQSNPSFQKGEVSRNMVLRPVKEEASKHNHIIYTNNSKRLGLIEVSKPKDSKPIPIQNTTVYADNSSDMGLPPFRNNPIDQSLSSRNITIYTNTSKNIGLPKDQSFSSTGMAKVSLANINTSASNTTKMDANMPHSNYLESFSDSDSSMQRFKQYPGQMNAFSDVSSISKFQPSFRADTTEASFIKVLGGDPSIGQYLQGVIDCCTELSYIHQHLGTNQVQYDTTQVGKQFQVTASLDFPKINASEFRKEQYKATSDPQKNTALARREAAKRLLVKLYSDNPQKWSEFRKIKQKKKLVY